MGYNSTFSEHFHLYLTQHSLRAECFETSSEVQVVFRFLPGSSYMFFLLVGPLDRRTAGAFAVNTVRTVTDEHTGALLDNRNRNSNKEENVGVRCVK